MKHTTFLTAVLYYLAVLALTAGTGSSVQAQSPIDPCVGCHTAETPEIVQQWEAGKHSKTGVKCYVCHHAEESNKKGMEHNDFFIITAVDVTTCESCHPEDGSVLLGRITKEGGKHP